MQLEEEKWNKRLAEYIKQIERKEYNKIDIDQFLKDVFVFKDNKENLSKESIIEYIKTNIQLQEVIAKNFNCNIDEIYFEKFRNYNNKIKISLDEAEFSYGESYDFSNLQCICGDACFYRSQEIFLRRLISIGGEADFVGSQISDLSSLVRIGGNAFFSFSAVINLSNLKNIGGCADFYDSRITNLSSLERVGGDLYLDGSKVNNLSSLKEVKGNVYLDAWQAELFGDMFVREGDHYRFVPENERANLKEEIEK